MSSLPVEDPDVDAQGTNERHIVVKNDIDTVRHELDRLSELREDPDLRNSPWKFLLKFSKEE